MKVNTIINRYIFLEMIIPFLISLMLFCFVFLMAKALDIANLIVNYDVSITKVLVIVAYMVPVFLEYVIPISVMIAVMLTFLRMSSDGEITVIESSGVSLFGMLPPVIVFCILGSIFAGLISIYGVPWGKASMKKAMKAATTQNLTGFGLKERTFIESIKGVTIYINSISKKDGTLHNVLVKDQRDKYVHSTTIAPMGVLFPENDNHASFIRLFNGSINQVDLFNQLVNTVNFDTYDIRLDIQAGLPTNRKKHKLEMSLVELWLYIKTARNKDADYNAILTELNLKFSLPLSCIIFGILAIPLGTISGNIKKSSGVGIGLFFVLIYYILLSVGRVFVESGAFSPFIGVWAPSIILFFTALLIFTRVSKNKPLINIGAIQEILRFFETKPSYSER
jgi:lipopolysaccharide export system permease protein